MPRSRLDVAAAIFKMGSETVHEKFLAILADPACAGCRSAGFGEAILTAKLQTLWISFSRDLILASTLGTRRKTGTQVRSVAGVRSSVDAERAVKKAAACASKKFGTSQPVWHAPSFVIDVGTFLNLNNLPQLQLVLGSALAPAQLTDFRNYLAHPDDRNRRKYERLQAKLGMHHMEPEELLHQFQGPGLRLFTSWVRELQRIADASTR